MGPDTGPDDSPARRFTNIRIPPGQGLYKYYCFLGCGFGRRDAPDVIAEAVIASKVAGKPVKLLWSREEDIKYDLYRATTCQRIEAGLDSQGRLTGWSHKVACSSILKFLNPEWIKDGVDSFSLWGIFDFPDTPRFLAICLRYSEPLFRAVPL